MTFSGFIQRNAIKKGGETKKTQGHKKHRTHRTKDKKEKHR
jgi:hypothetical protein